MRRDVLKSGFSEIFLRAVHSVLDMTAILELPYSDDTDPMIVYRDRETIEELNEVATVAIRCTDEAIEFIDTTSREPTRTSSHRMTRIQPEK